MPNYWGRNVNPATRGWGGVKKPTVPAIQVPGGPPAIKPAGMPGMAALGATSRKTAFADGGSTDPAPPPGWDPKQWKDWLAKSDAAQARGVDPTRYDPATYASTSDQSRTAAFSPTRDWRYDNPPPAATFVDAMGRVDPVKYQAYMQSAARAQAAQAAARAPSREIQPQSQPVTKLSSNAAVTKKINDMIGPPPEPFLTSASDWGGTPADSYPYDYGGRRPGLPTGPNTTPPSSVYGPAGPRRPETEFG